jgi:hypothetical protein
MNFDPHHHDIKTIEQEIIDEIDRQHAAVAAGNDELAQMIHLSIQGLKLRRAKLQSKADK